MPDAHEQVHTRLVTMAQLPPGGRVIDLGCGKGSTLRAFAAADPATALVGYDHDAPELAQAREHLRIHPGGVRLVTHDLRERLTENSDSADAVVSYNTLECLPDPNALITEALRVLAPGGLAVFAHTDFDSLMVSGVDTALDRKILRAFADLRQPWTGAVDPGIARKILGLLARAGAEVEAVEALRTFTTGLDGHAARRLAQVRDSLRDSASGVPPDEVLRWYAQIETAAANGGFVFAETTIVTTARKAALPVRTPGRRRRRSQGLSAFLAANSLPQPPVPDSLRDAVGSQGPFCLSTRRISPMDMYLFETYLVEALTRPVEPYVAASFCGHGVNSHGVHYHLVYGPLTVFAQAGFGGIYSDRERDTAQVTRMFAECAALIDAVDRAGGPEAFPPGRQLFACSSNFRGMHACMWLDTYFTDAHQAANELNHRASAYDRAARGPFPALTEAARQLSGID